MKEKTVMMLMGADIRMTSSELTRMNRITRDLEISTGQLQSRYRRILLQTAKRNNNTSSNRSSSDYSPSSLNAQQLVAQEFSKDTTKKDNNHLAVISPTKKDNIMRRGTENQAYYVLGHKTPNIRDLYTLGRKLGQGQFGTTYLATEISTGNGAYEDPLSVHIVMELCSGGCHSLGVMHRDLKPENFLLVNKDDDFSLKAIDFGLSVFFKLGQVFTDVVGSPYYVAPEVLLKHYGPEADVSVWTAGVILYILLSGVPPFWAETQQGIFDAVLKGHIDFDSDPWPLISDSAKDLIRRMLCSRPSEWLTAHEVLCHPWICENGVAPDRALDPAVLSRLKTFYAMNKLKKMALRVDFFLARSGALGLLLYLSLVPLIL
ncbi:hypothetical protein CCACVL1_01767 [Corchorus capsularis]|uniref:Protein kinase domain-containing protein n=1 Tax=Corchorus capsularis TaxID=210143 RepID=A0A1R3KFW9_COCAP|nr:hypothetical protein CCACVL1_01767 [Corchorus capsularis]